MFDFLKSRKKSSDLLQKWHIPIDATYKRINNADSVQYINSDESCILYFSPLAITGSQLFSTETFAKMKLSVIKTKNGWQLNGAKQTDNDVLVCVFTYTSESDESWMKSLFENITYAYHKSPETK